MPALNFPAIRGDNTDPASSDPEFLMNFRLELIPMNGKIVNDKYKKIPEGISHYRAVIDI
jgi:hypothetical protein